MEITDGAAVIERPDIVPVDPVAITTGAASIERPAYIHFFTVNNKPPRQAKAEEL